MVVTDIPNSTTPRGEGRERILDEARDRFLSKGFAATSMQEIADAIGVTKPALYYHFKDKQDLLLAVLGREMTAGRDAFFRSLADHASMAERLEFGAIWCFQRIKGDIGRLMSDMHRELPGDKVHQFKCNHPMPVELVAHILNEAHAQGELAPSENPEMLARLFVGMIFGQLALQSSDDFAGMAPEDLGRLVTRVFLSGVHTA
jgi:AcrR family transcriptional regulator